MNENIDLTKILKGCPNGTKLYSTLHGEVLFREMYLFDKYPADYPIRATAYGKNENSVVSVYCTKDGRGMCQYDGECILFPSKEQRDWSKFVRFWDKPKVEKFDVNTLQPFDKVLVRGQNGQNWIATFFSHIDNIFNMVVCGAQYWKYCIPYNDKTKHLRGTNNDCPDYYKWWEE